MSSVESLNFYGDFWWSLVSSQFAQAAFVGLVTLLAVRLLARTPAHWRYALLLVAVAKFAVPPVATSLPTGVISKLSPLVTPSALAETQTATTAKNDTVEPTFAAVEVPNATFPTPQAGSTSVRELVTEASSERTFAATDEHDEIANADKPAQRSVTAAMSPTPRVSWKGGLLLAHVFGSIVLLISATASSRRVIADRGDHHAGLTQTASRLAKEIGLRNAPPVFVSDKLRTPISFGVVRPGVAIPRGQAKALTDDQLRLVLLHELTHHRRSDLLVLWIQLFVLAMWWFHPVLWLLNRAIKTVREECCDDFLLAKRLVADHFYCDTLMRLAAVPSGKTDGRFQSLTAALSMADTNRRRLAHRMERLMDVQLARRTRLGIGGCALTLVTALVLLPGMRGSEVAAQSNPSASISLPLREPTTPSNPEHVVSGRVVDEQGRGVVGVKVWLAIDAHWSEVDGPAILGRATTAADGSWQLTPSGDCSEKASDPPPLGRAGSGVAQGLLPRRCRIQRPSPDRRRRLKARDWRTGTNRVAGSGVR